ncbi:MAG: UDP-glucose--tetrahydrobiopterin glucosyltransferase [Alkalinema sp. CACIAM 70d]|nr:MAG: UDP-glucose--tetrahydrobiopterin glucosyltransferase [Alkalinema sp. CACIAM 70d]
MRSLKLLFVSTPVGALGSGLGGGVELTLRNLAIALQQRGHSITVVAPEGSQLDNFSLVEIVGSLQTTAQSQGRDAPITLPSNSVLSNLWSYVRQVQNCYDIIVNFAYDWLPFYLTPFFETPIAHLVSMGSLSEAMDQAIVDVADSFPNTIAVHSHAQAQTFSMGFTYFNLQNGIDLSQYEFCPNPDEFLAWVGRIAPEKGLEDAVQAAAKTGLPLKIFGVIQDPAYWAQIQADYPQAAMEWMGFLPTQALQQALGRAQALLMTPKWVEAFGNVAIEALACGVPVIAYRRGGPAEIIQSGYTGWLVEPDSVEGLVQAIAKIPQISRTICHREAEMTYSLAALGERAETWLARILPHELAEESAE